MHITIYPHTGWFGPDARQRLTPWGFRFGPPTMYDTTPILLEPLALTLQSLAAWEALLRDLRYTAVVTGGRDPAGDHAFTLVLDALPTSSPVDEAHARTE